MTLLDAPQVEMCGVDCINTLIVLGAAALAFVVLLYVAWLQQEEREDDHD